MTTVQEFTDPLIPSLRRVLPAGAGICNICHGAPGTGWLRCYSCSQTVGQVTRPVQRVVPISLSRTDGQFYHLLKTYKWSTATRYQRVQLAALYIRFLDEHGECVGDWDTITIVPSSGERIGAHPLAEVMTVAANVLRTQYESLLARGAGALARLQPADDGYAITTPVNGRRVLLVDDTFTTGSRVQSAASTLQLAGADVIAAVVAGRIMNPDFNAETAAVWERAGTEPFSFDSCCLCG